MIYFTDAEIDQLINEDLPYYDLTSLSVKMGSKVARISFATRHNTVVCGTEEVLKIFEKFRITPTLISFSGEQIEEGFKFLEGEGLANSVHAIWRTAASLLEFASGIATRTRELIDKAHAANPDIAVVTTRKSIPFTKKIAVKAVRAGGGNLHRLGLSDSILIFDNHIKFLGGLGQLILKLPEIRHRAAGRSITVEVNNEDDALSLASTGINALQLDHFGPKKIRELIPKLRKVHPTLKIIAAGNIDISNIADFANTGVDTIVASSPYYGKPADFTVNIEPVFDM
jgi:molybdenum transport protein